MKVRNYEKKELIVILSIVLFTLEFIFIASLITNKIYAYQKITGIVLKDDLLIVVASKEERKLLFKNSFIYLNSKKEKFKIVEDRGAIITKNNTKYYELLISTKLDKKYKANDTLSVSIKTEKKRLIEIFKAIGGG